MRARGLVDVLIPRGGAVLIQTVVEESTVPVIETGVGNCHVYVDEAADLEKALAVVLNAKTQRLSICNTAESLLVHAASPTRSCRWCWRRCADAGRDRARRRRGWPRLRRRRGRRRPRRTGRTEYLSADISAAVVDSLDDAVDHIRRYGTGHTEAIVTESVAAARRFVARVDAAAVMVNASTRFTDGGEFGFGAEIGISHAEAARPRPDGPARADLAPSTS